MELTNEEKAKVFAMYLGCNFRYRYVDYEDGVWAVGASSTFERLSRVFTDKSIDAVQLLLTPLSKITDEHAIEVADILLIKYFSIEYNKRSKYDGSLCKDGLFFILESIFKIRDFSGIDPVSAHQLYQYLISKGYAVPLFFSPGHWANGKTAIELGIAIENPTP